ncbi:chaperone modulator CbpM [Dysgonomonas massiliensis]|uniref:chaperone modulator CbpM n=1 Tax=Dysgonomonas massiliensis TaxID=2040292 RepID=UPI000C79024A|nr:chaperone modulator CbpM [Dysgonomonas massiliensis]
MDTELIIVSEYCSQNRIEPEFLFSLEEVGLVDFIKRNDEYYLYISQLGDLDRYVRWHYELSINAEGIDVIQNLMNRINEMQGEISRLKEIIRLLEE